MGIVDAAALPLTGVRVVAFEQAVAAPLCTRHLADLGADVVKVERQGEGDFARAYDSAIHGTSTWFAWLNRGKRSLTLDLKHAQGREVAERLVARADVVVQNFAPGAFERLGLGVAQLHERYPGADRGVDHRLRRGRAVSRPARLRPAAAGRDGRRVGERHAGGRGEDRRLGRRYRRRHVRLQLDPGGALPAAADRRGRGDPRQPVRFDHGVDEPAEPDGGARAAAAARRRAPRQHRAVRPVRGRRAGARWCWRCRTSASGCGCASRCCDRPDLAADARFAGNENRLRNRRELEPQIEAALSRYGVEEAEAALEAACGAVRAHERRRGGAAPPAGAGARAVADARRCRAAPRSTCCARRSTSRAWRRRRREIPAVGQHTDAVLAELGYDAAAIAALRASGAV